MRMLDPYSYKLWVLSKRDTFRLIVRDDYEARMRHQPEQAINLVNGLVDLVAARMAQQNMTLSEAHTFTAEDVMKWFDIAFVDTYLQTRLGAVKIFYYYLRILKEQGIVQAL